MKVFTKKEEQILLSIYHLKDKAYLIPIREEIKKYTGKEYSVGTIYAPLNRLHVYGYLTKRGYAALGALKNQNEMMWKGFKTPVFEDKH